ncbi:hypothetical protein CsatA_016903 [Cannabis sativa]
MFYFFMGWRKASKCKRLIKRLQCRLKLVKNKRYAIVRQLRNDLAQLIKIGHQNTAFIRAEQLIKDEAVNAAYELLESFCDFILVHFSYIRKTKDCPNEINEAISSLIFASPRCGDLPELLQIRRFFTDRYGQNFATVALELFPGNHVNLQVKEKLSTLSISEDMKQKLVNEIVKEYCLKPDILALDYYSDWEEQQMKIKSSEDQALMADVPTSYHGISEERSELHSSMLEKVEFVDLPIHSKPWQDLSKYASAVTSEQKVVPAISESQAEKEDTSGEGDSQQGKGNFSETKKERSVTASSSESLPKVDDEMLVYMDDIEEFQSSTPKDEDSQDQRLFKFKESSLKDSDQLGNKKVNSSLRDFERSSSVSSKRRTRRRLVFRENQTIEDNQCLSYYGQDSSNKQRSNHVHQQIKQHRKTSVDYESENRPNQFYNSDMGFTSLSRNRRCYPKRPECCCCCCNHKTRHSCSGLESPCYFVAEEDIDNDIYEAPSFRKPNNLSRSHYSREHMYWNGEEELNEEVESITVPQKPRRRSYDNSASMDYDVFTYSDHQIQSQNNVVKRFGPRGSQGKDLVPPYIRTVTMPQEKPKDISNEDFQRCKTFPIQTPKHVHPMLPDYDDIAARFMALKKERSCH